MIATRVYQALAIRKGLESYVKHRIRLNTAWTPAAMLRTAGAITGKTYGRGQYEAAIADLTTWIEQWSASAS